MSECILLNYLKKSSCDIFGILLKYVIACRIVLHLVDLPHGPTLHVFSRKSMYLVTVFRECLSECGRATMLQEFAQITLRNPIRLSRAGRARQVSLKRK